MKIWICASCGTPIEPVFHEQVEYCEGALDIRCPGSDSECSPHPNRELVTPEQVMPVDLSGVAAKIGCVEAVIARAKEARNA